MPTPSDVSDNCSLGELVRPHLTCITDATGGTAFASGWRRIATRLLEAWAAALRRHPGASVAIGAFGARAGGLRVVFDANLDGTPTQDLAATLKRLRDDAEREAAQTCDLCGHRGVLRVTGEGDVAIRCDRHGDPGSTRLLVGPSVSTEEVVEVLLHSHAGWLDSADAFAELPRGWLGLVTEAFAELRKLPTGQGFRLRSLRPVCGRLDLVLEHDIEDLSLEQYLAWRTAALALGDAALFTCDVCGANGRIRYPAEGVPAPRCDAHVDFARWPSMQSSSHVESTEQVVITSSRPQWNVEALNDLGAAAAAEPVTEAERTAGHLALYQIPDVSAALGLADDEGDDPLERRALPADNEHQSRLRRILDRGDAGRWRRLAAPRHDMLDALDAVARRAPHMHELSTLMRRHLAAAINVGLPVSLPPVIVVGEPGIGKTWFMTALAHALGLPFRSHPMTGASHSDGIGGAHPVWRNAEVGLVAKTLLTQEVANPLIFIDEFDKVPRGRDVDDLYKSFYALLEPLGARTFVDAYLGFPVDASKVGWIFAANDLEPIPKPILSRLTVVVAHAPSPEHLAVIASSIYEVANGHYKSFFPAQPSVDLIERLTGMSPRSMRLAIEHAMTCAASDGRREVRADDLPRREQSKAGRARIGFL